MNGSSSSLYPERMADVDPNTTYTVAYMYETKEGEISFPSETADFCMRDHLKRLELTDAAMVGKGQYAFALPHEMNTKHLRGDEWQGCGRIKKEEKQTSKVKWINQHSHADVNTANDKN